MKKKFKGRVTYLYIAAQRFVLVVSLLAFRKPFLKAPSLWPFFAMAKASLAFIFTEGKECLYWYH